MRSMKAFTLIATILFATAIANSLFAQSPGTSPTTASNVPAAHPPGASDHHRNPASTVNTVSRPTIATEKLQALIDFALRTDKEFPTASMITQGLGLPNPFMTKNAKIEKGTTRHGLAVGISDATRIIFYRKTPEVMQVYATDRRAELLSAGTIINNVFNRISVNDARADFEAELRIWAAEPIKRATVESTDKP